jgi:hypothetical protein
MTCESSSVHLQNDFARSGPDELDPWAEFRNPDGTFKYWLHTWAYAPSPTTRAITRVKCASPLPWLWNIPPDSEFIWAMVGTGYTKLLPGSWAHVHKPTGKEQWHWVNGKMYGAVFDSFSDEVVSTYLGRHQRQFVTKTDFMVWLQRNHLLFSRNLFGDVKS